MTKTFALLLDSYRELNAKKLFWVVIALSGLVVFIFGAVGLDGDAISIFAWKTPFRFSYFALLSHATFYKIIFARLGVDIWLTWIATVLALVSTAGIFPDFMASGSIDLYLSKPLSRLRLFITKYLGGLLFVSVQVAVFTACCFLLLGWRGGSWEPSLFLAVPVVVLMFSYLFAICVLLGVMTRSTIASVLLTLLLWFILCIVQLTESGLLLATVTDQRHAAYMDRRIAATQAEIDDIAHQSSTTAPASRPTDDASDDQTEPAHSNWFGWLPGGSSSRAAKLRTQLTDLKTERAAFNGDRFVLAHNIAFGVMTPLPKTSGTIKLLTDQLEKLADMPKVEDPQDSTATIDVSDDRQGPGGRNNFRRNRQEREYDGRQVEIELRGRSAAWILGTSCAFEAVVLGLAAWLFCRRDY